MNTLPPTEPLKAALTPPIAATDAERVHHSYSPSSLQSLEACPCYRNKQEAVLNERCIAGTKAHNVTETGEDDKELSDEDAVAAAECMDFYERRVGLLEEARSRAVKEHIANHPDIIAEAVITPLIELKETYLSIDDEVFNDEYTDPRTRKVVKETVKATTAGFVDRAVINHDRTYAELFDWKFGLWPVEQADNNLQGISYSLGLFKQYPSLQKIQFWFKQPHLEHISSATFLRCHIPELYLRVQVVVAKARAARHAGDFSTARPMVPVCNFCANIGICPKVTEFVCKVGAKFHPMEIPESITPTMVHDPKNSAIGKRLAQVVKIWADAFSRQLADRILRGEAPLPEGFRIETRANRVIVDKDKFKEITLRYMTEAEYLATFDPAFGPLEKLINEKAPRGQKKEMVATYQKDLTDGGAVDRDLPYSFLKAVPSK
jgi:hypothetical protein